jgi:hypothetical protein
MSITIQHIYLIDDPYEWQGYKIVMSDPSKNIVCKISNIANCCERFGIFVNNELTTFIGAEYQSVSIPKREDKVNDWHDGMRIVDVAIQTDRGEILIQLYNEHNGYYRHDFFTETEHGTTIQSL